MSAKQDRAPARTPEDLERKYRFEKQFKDINKSLAQSQKAADDARKTADEAQKSYDSLNERQGELSSKIDEMETRAGEIETDATNLSNTVDGLGRDLEERIGDVANYVGYPSTTDSIFKKVYPVGSIYMSVNSTSPATLFGGTWTQLKDRFLIGTGSTYSNGATGGEATHKLTPAEMPSHAHIQQATEAYTSWARKQVQIVGSTSSGSKQDVSTVATSGTLNAAGVYASAVYTQQNGGDGAHNNMPPYLAVYMWKRTA